MKPQVGWRIGRTQPERLGTLGNGLIVPTRSIPRRVPADVRKDALVHGASRELAASARALGRMQVARAAATRNQLLSMRQIAWERVEALAADTVTPHLA